MENATKGLLIAGGVLIAIIILSIGVYLYSIFSKQTKEYNEKIANTEIQKFNSQFEIYINRNDITPQEIVSAYNLAKKYNDINIRIVSLYRPILINDSESFLEQYKTTLFECNNFEYDNNGKIKSLQFISIINL